MIVLWIGVAFGLGLLARQVNLPPLVGYLAAGFGLNIAQQWLALPLYDEHALEETLEPLAHAGVLLLLFTVGLKLKLKSLLRPEIWSVETLHALLFGSLMMVVMLLLGSPSREALFVAVALCFSSTILTIKTLESKREMGTFHGRVAVGILVFQDLLALLVLTLAGDHHPSPYALLLLLLPLLRPLLRWLLTLSDHGELLLLLGLLLGLGGGTIFEAMGLSGELGALIVGAMLADHRRVKELADGLWGLKDVFLVGFFLSIGLAELPQWSDMGLALLFVALLPIKGMIFAGLLVLFRLRARSAFLSGLYLSNYSEFGLIVAALLLPEWLALLALATALSFLIGAPLNRSAHGLYSRLEPYLLFFERRQRHPDDEPITLGMAGVMIMGMGRIGTAAYDFFKQRGERPVGLDADPTVLQKHLDAGRRVRYADADDVSFWQNVHLDHVRVVLLTMRDGGTLLNATQQLRSAGYDGKILACCRYDDEANTVLAAGADFVYLAESEAGFGLAEHAWEALYPNAVVDHPPG